MKKLKIVLLPLLASMMFVSTMFNPIQVAAASFSNSTVPLSPMNEKYNLNDTTIEPTSVTGTVAALLAFALANFPQIYDTVAAWINSYGTKLTFGQIYDAVMYFIQNGEWPY